MKIIVRGSPREIDFFNSVCLIKFGRGLLRITPAPDAVKPYDDEVHKDDEKAVDEVDSKEPADIDNKYCNTDKDTKAVAPGKKGEAVASKQ